MGGLVGRESPPPKKSPKKATMDGALDSRDLGGFSDRLVDLKRSLDRLYDSKSADKYLLSLEETADAARALFADDHQTSSLKNMPPQPGRDYEPMLRRTWSCQYDCTRTVLNYTGTGTGTGTGTTSHPV